MAMTFRVNVGRAAVKTTVINTVAQLDQSLRVLIDNISKNVCGNDYKCVVGVGVEKEFRPSSSTDVGGGSNQVSEKVAVLKLCNGTSCLIIQLLQLNTAPCSLSNFLRLPWLSFVGVKVEHCLKALERDYGIKCRNAFDVGELAATLREKEAYRGYGLLNLARRVICLDVNKRKHLMDSFTAAALSNWGVNTLSHKSATSDASICFYIGNMLYRELS